jgi:FdhE protein
MYTATDDNSLGKLEELEEREGELSGLTQSCRQLLALQSEAKSRFVVSSSFDETTSSHRLAQGTPLLSFEDLSLEQAEVGTLYQEVASLLAGDSPDLPGEVEGLRNIASNKPLLDEVVRAWYEGFSLTDIAVAHDVDNELLTFVIATVLKPFLQAYSEALLPLVKQEAWRRRYCPICGGKPDFAFLETERGARWLCCSRCDAQWLFQRLECPYCGSQKHDSLAYFTDDEGLYRLYVCEECRSYIKTIDLRCAKPSASLFVERIVTLDIDKQAQQEGYRRGCEEPNSLGK